MSSSVPESESQQIADDVKTLESLGYQQELRRGMSGYANFALSFSNICILAGGITSFHIGFCGVGGAAIGLGWPLFFAFSMIVGLAMGQIASAFPTAGGLYHWSSILGGRFWGWLTAWLNLAGLIAVIAAINVGTYQFFVASFGSQIGFQPELWGASGAFFAQLTAVGLITLAQAIINHRGIKLTAFLVELNGHWILICSAILTVALLAGASSWDFTRLWTFTNYSGSNGGDVLPQSSGLVWLFALGLLLPAYTLTGFDASAHAAEETIGAAKSAPQGIVRSVAVSGFAGWILLSAAVLAMPSMDQAALKGPNAFAWTIEQTTSKAVMVLVYAGILVAQFFCGLSTVTSTSRMIYAFARDRGFVGHRWLRQVNPKSQAPVAAIWAASIVSILFTLYVPVYSTITAVSSIFLYMSYVLPTALGLFAYGRTWTKMGPWSLGWWFRPIAVGCIIGCIGLMAIAMQPPNEKSLWVVFGSVGFLILFWFAWERNRFPGPPQTVIDVHRKANSDA